MDTSKFMEDLYNEVNQSGMSRILGGGEYNPLATHNNGTDCVAINSDKKCDLINAGGKCFLINQQNKCYIINTLLNCNN